MTAGVLDVRAARAFTQGQCHALALALHERTGWPVHWVEDEEGDPLHCFVLDPAGRAVDITGVHDRDEFVSEWGAWDESVDTDALRSLPFGFGGWRIPRTDVAAQFVDAVLAAHSRGEALYPPGPEGIPEPDDTEPLPELAAFTVVARDGSEVALPTAALTDEVRGFLRTEQSYALALALARELPGDRWDVGLVERGDELSAYVVDVERGVAVDADGARALASLPHLDIPRLREVPERFEEAGYVATDYGIGEHYAKLLAAELDLP